MSVLADYCKQLISYFKALYELTEDQASLYREVSKALRNKEWTFLNQNLERMESLAREQGRISKQILQLRKLLQQQLQVGQHQLLDSSQLLKISELLPLLSAQSESSKESLHLRKIWHELSNSLIRRQGELQVLQLYSQEKQEIIQGFLSALRDEDIDRGQTYGKAGGQYQSGVAAPARIFNGEA